MTTPEPISPQPEVRRWALTPEAEPVFGLGEVAAVFVMAALAMIVCAAVAVAVAQHMAAFHGVRPVELANEAKVLLPAQLAAYLLVIAALWRLFTAHHGIGFLEALHWKWPRRWPLFMAGGVGLAVAVQLGAQLLPTPPELPIDKMMQNSQDAWMMAGFGVLVAPFVEEPFFRGLLFPALARRAGLWGSMVLTAISFGAVHSGQLAGAWIQVSCIVAVGLVLTAVRYRYRSLASSTLVHVGYNGALFAALFLQTKGFTDFMVR